MYVLKFSLAKKTETLSETGLGLQKLARSSQVPGESALCLYEIAPSLEQRSCSLADSPEEQDIPSD